MKPELTIKKRNGKIAPFIGGRNVWDLTPAIWKNESVRQAIKSAYEIGYDRAKRDMQEALCAPYLGPEDWDEE
jgi:hypothetical protein